MVSKYLEVMKKGEGMEKEGYYYWLANAPGIGRVTMKRIVEVTEPEEIYHNGVQPIEAVLSKEQKKALEKHRLSWDIEKEWKRLKEKEIRFYCIKSEAYPGKLKQIPDPPLVLYARGETRYLDMPSVAVVGARECSAYGALAAKELGRELAERGITVVSGMARGIDGISQWAALEQRGGSVGVLGSGVEVCYPKENRPLYERLKKQGCLLSESHPYTPAKAGLFPQRNRLISGLADVVVVVEAKAKSGTLITVDMALEQGREVYAMPGRITDALSEGCNHLIRQGAQILLSPRRFADEMAVQLGLNEKQKENAEDGEELSLMERALYQILEPLPMSVEELWQKGRIKEPELTLSQVMEGLLMLVMKGKACTHEQYFYRKHFG